MSLETEQRTEERRAEPRRRTRTAIKLWPEGFVGGTGEGRLVDRSAHGFRARHSWKGLTNGQFVQFESPWLAGRARVVWTRIAGDHVESGFLIVASDR